MSAAEELFEIGYAPFSVPLPVKLSQYADEHFYLAPDSSSIEGPWTSLPYQIGPLNWIGNDDISTITWKKSARVGYTKIVCAGVVYFIEHKRRNTTVYQPTDGDARTFADDEIKPLLVHVPALRAVCKSDPEKKSSDFTIERSKFLGATLDVLGGKSARNYRRYTKDVVIYDELAGFDSDIDGEGSPTSLGDTRLETSSFPKSIRGSTPKTKGTCLITASLDEADFVVVRWLPCPDCGEFQYLKWKGTDGVYKFDIETGAYSCEHCGVAIGYEKYSDMDKLGQWRTKDGAIYYDEELDRFFNLDGEAIPDPDHLGIELWSAYSYFLTWAKLVKGWKKANDELKKTGEVLKLKTFINTKLGQEWEESGERIEGAVFEGERLDETKERIANGVLFLTMGVDVQGGKNARVEYEIVGHGIGEESWSLEYDVIKGDIESQFTKDHLDIVRKKKFIREDGVSLGVSCCCVDSGYNSDAVYKYTTPRQRQRVYATKGYSVAGKQIVGTYTLQGPNKKTRLYMVGADTAKEVLFYRLDKILNPGPGFCHFPEDRGDDYFLQLTAEEKRKERNKKTKKTSYVWVKIRDRNEALDCRILNIVGLKILNPPYQTLKRRLDRLAEKIAAATNEPSENENEVQEKSKPAKNIRRRPIKRPKKTGGFTGGFRK